MNIVALLVKVAGLFATITVGANALSYTRFRRRNLGKIRSPIDESKEVLADFNSHGTTAFRYYRACLYVSALTVLFLLH